MVLWSSISISNQENAPQICSYTISMEVIPQSFICSVFDDTIYLHYSLMVCHLFYGLPLCLLTVTAQSVVPHAVPSCCLVFLVFGRLMAFWYLASRSLLQSWHSSCQLPLPVTPLLTGLNVSSSWNPASLVPQSAFMLPSPAVSSPPFCDHCKAS